MKNLSKLLRKSQDIIQGSWIKALVVVAIFAAPVLPANVPFVGTSTVMAEGSALTSGSAEGEFKKLYQNIRSFAGFLLIIGTVLAGILFVTGKTTMAMAVFIGAVIVYGGAFVIQLVNDSFGS